MLPKLKYEHVFLTSYSKMRVDLAAQVRKLLIDLYVICVVFYIRRYSVIQ